MFCAVINVALVPCSNHFRDKGEIIALKNTGGALGIHVVPEYDEKGRFVVICIAKNFSN